MTGTQKKELFEAIAFRYDNLPTDLRRTMVSATSTEIIQEIARKNELNDEKTGLLAEETGYVLLGFINHGAVPDDLIGLLEVNKTQANEIAAELDQKIFLPVKDMLIKTHGEDFWGAEPLTDNQPFDSAQGKQPFDIPRQGSGQAAQGRQPATPEPPAALPISEESAPTASETPKIVLPKIEVPPAPQQPTASSQQPATPPMPPTPPAPPVMTNPADMPPAPIPEPPRRIPDVEEELRPKLVDSLPKEKPLEARIAQKTQPGFKADPYRETVE